MAKKYYWEIEEDETDLESGEPTGEKITHTLLLVCSKLTGKIKVTIDGTEFDISEKPFSLGGVEQVFRLGDMAAVLRFSKSGVPSIIIDNEVIAPK